MDGSRNRRAGDRDALPLTARERRALFRNRRVVALGQLLDEAVRVPAPRRRFDRDLVDAGEAEANVLADRRGEQHRLLRDDADLLPQRAQVAASRSMPSMSTRPSLGSIRRGTSDTSVVLPQPFGPTRATISP
jgi:hypothetical protein